MTFEIEGAEDQMFNTIVVGVDGREGGRDALSLAARLAVLAGGELVAVRVLRFDDYASRAGAAPYSSLGEHDAKAQLEADLEQAGVTARARILGDTSPARALHRVAEEEQADVIVVGSTHHGSVGRVFAGDDAVGTLHGAPCAVAVAPRGLASREWQPFKRIAVGYDGGAEAGQAFALAIALARDCRASVRVRSVVATPVPYADFTPYEDDWTDRALAVAKTDLAELVSDVDVETVTEATTGTTVGELVALSDEADLLVLGSRGWGPVRRIVMGSATACLTREARCPVLVLPRGAATGQPGEAEAGQMTVA
jgi:nucleotide-binding universal stress UspA family protein